MIAASVQFPLAADLSGVTELRVHGVGGTPPDALLGDLAPEQVGGDRIAGFYRTSDHRAVKGDCDTDRHVEAYSWSGLTSRSRSRVLWLALLPFMLGNLAGWMCSPKTRQSSWRFALHRTSAALGALALTVNVALVAVMITADVLAYQAVRAGLAGNQWWLAPLRWPQISGHPARQVLVGVLVPIALILILALLAGRARRRYEAVSPPFRGVEQPKPRLVAAAALDSPRGLANDDFWDGERSVRLLAWLHVAVAVGFLAIVLDVTARALVVAGKGSPHAITWWWIAVCAGGTAVALAVAYLCADAAGAVDGAGTVVARVIRTRSRAPGRSPAEAQQIADRLRDALAVLLLVLAAIAVVIAGVFAWLQPGGTSVHETAATLPGLASVIGWTVLGIAVPVAVVGVSVLLGAARSGGGRLFGGPLVILALAFSVLNTVMFGVLSWVAHIVGPVTTDAAAVSASHPMIYVPYGITVGIPLVALAAVAAGIIFGLMEMGRHWLARQVPDGDLSSYRKRAEKIKNSQTRLLSPWYWSALAPPVSQAKGSAAPHATQGGGETGRVNGTPASEAPQAAEGRGWERTIARARWLGRAPHDAGWFLWGVILLQLAVAFCIWQFRWNPPLYLRNAGTVVAAGLLTPLMAYLYSAWSRPDRRRRVAVLWDIGTFWPRSYHPLSPPCYAERAVPDLQRRMWWLHDNGGRVLLVAHSQGTMLAVAAVLQAGRLPPAGRVALVTFGSPVCKLYGWAFPAYITADLLTALAPGARPALVDNWRNFYYPTDPIAGPVTPGPGSRDASLVNRELPDPAECWYIYGQPLPKAQGHSGYWADPRVWDEINCLASGLSEVVPPGPPAAQPAGTI